MILARLREETADLHAGLERTLPLGCAVLGREEYARVLAAFRGFFATWESEALRHAPASLLPLVRERQRLPLLDADLAQLGEGTPSATALDPAQLPDLGDPAQLLGSMYVLEGSRLGGQIIAKRVRDIVPGARAGHASGPAVAFFTGFGPETGRRWKSFCSVLEAFAITPSDAARMISAARATFLAFDLWMRATSPLGTAACQ
jgi:heme oxygenase